MKHIENILLIVLIGLSSCNYFKPDHPQANSAGSESLISKEDIRAYADSINTILDQLNRQQSLVYTSNDYSFFVTRYSYNGKPLLYIEAGNSAENDTVQKKYYLKNNEPVLITEMKKSVIGKTPYSLRQNFLRNNISFYSDSRDAASENDLKTAPPHEIPAPGSDISSVLKRLNDAIDQEGKFNLVFEGITGYPKARYIILSRNEVNAYRAPVRIKDEDDFAKELIANPSKYKGRKLDLSWSINPGMEAIYISGKLHSTSTD